LKASLAQRKSNKQQLLQKLNGKKQGKKKGRKGRKKGRRRREIRKGRGKRMAIDDDDRFWTNGIIPYVFTSEIKCE
jgi:hypothetical protein